MFSYIYLINFILLAVLAILTTASNYAFLSIGDWGGAALEDPQYSKNVYDVAGRMATVASEVSAKLVVNTGDNFYWCGIQSTSDSQIDVDYVKPYSAAPLQVKWYNALGNHEYGYNVQAQLDYMKINSKWILPQRYYSERIQLSDSNYMTLLFLDTSPCISDYRNDNPKYWDPCSTTYPTCSQKDTDDDFEGTCMFHENILSQDCTAQYTWLQKKIVSIPISDWLVVIGHHPIDEVDVKDMTTLIQNRGFSIYLNGHTHCLSQYKIDGAGAYITTGAGAMVDTVTQEHHPITKAKLEGQTITPEMRANHRFQRDKNSTTTTTSTTSSSSATSVSLNETTTIYVDHSYSTVWTQKIAGFTLHTFSSDFATLTTDFYSYKGDIIHSFTVNKQGTIL